ncbi:MAG TPA: glycine cleavage system protein GcvH [Ignavibacteria bacterium]|nr:glycine cleavage system protein GcvH [Ignavibacteria bacterium]
MNIPEKFKYTNDHEYINLADTFGFVGITDYAQSELGDIIYVDITVSAGDEVKQGDVLGSIEAVKTVSELKSPVSGKVTEINSKINDNPSVVNEDPYNEGWMVKIEPSNMDEFNNLLDKVKYSELVGNN